MNQMALFAEETEVVEKSEEEPVATSEIEGKQTTYCTVQYTVGWLPSSIGFTEQAKIVLAEERGTDKKAIRGSYAILGASLDPLIKEGTALKRVLSAIRDEFTIHEYEVRVTAADVKKKAETKKEAEAETDEQAKTPEKVKGGYLIETVQIDEFLERFMEAREQLLLWGQRIAEPENYNRIREADKKALGKDWEIIESKYPNAAALADAISCNIPKIDPFAPEFNLEDLAPETKKILEEQRAARLDAAVDGFLGECIQELMSMTEHVAKCCGKRVRLLPPMGPKQDLRHAEVMQIMKHADDPAIPEGKFLVTAQRTRPKSEDSDKYINVGKSEDMLLSEAEYKALRPYETDEHRQLAQSSFDNLMWYTKKVSKVKSALNGDDGGEVLDLVAEIESALGELGGTASEITKQLKGSSYARTASKKTFASFAAALKTTQTKVKSKRTRRKFKIGGTEDVE